MRSSSSRVRTRPRSASAPGRARCPPRHRAQDERPRRGAEHQLDALGRRAARRAGSTLAAPRGSASATGAAGSRRAIALEEVWTRLRAALATSPSRASCRRRRTILAGHAQHLGRAARSRPATLRRRYRIHRRAPKGSDASQHRAEEIIIVLVIALLVLGPKRLPEVGRSVGRGMREFKDSLSGVNAADDDEDDEAASRCAAGPRAESPRSMRISRALLDDVIAHAREDAPNECCGLIATRDGVAVEVHRARTSPPARCATRWTAWSSTASRPRSRTPGSSSGRSTTRTRARRPIPSQTDINLAVLSGGGVHDRRPRGRRARRAGWRIVDGRSPRRRSRSRTERDRRSRHERAARRARATAVRQGPLTRSVGPPPGRGRDARRTAAGGGHPFAGAPLRRVRRAGLPGRRAARHPRPRPGAASRARSSAPSSRTSRRRRARERPRGSRRSRWRWRWHPCAGHRGVFAAVFWTSTAAG